MKSCACAIVAPCSCLGLAPAHARGPTRRKIAEKIDINAPADKVWAIVKDFDGLANWHPAVASSATDKGNGIGSLRTAVSQGAQRSEGHRGASEL